MDAKAAVSVEQYLLTSFPDLDREYRDGELVERTWPDYLHGETQVFLASFFDALRAVFHRVRPHMRVPDTPPLAAVEILSPADRLTAVREKLEEYRAWGVPHVWLVDPYSKRMYISDGGFAEVPSLTITELSIELTPTVVFQDS